MTETLLRTLPKQKLALIGDIHGEIKALDALLEQLQPDNQERRLIFLGDLCDRGPDSVACIHRVRELVDAGRAHMVLGNHEINLLANDAKDGSGWFFDCRNASDTPFYAPFVRASARERPVIRDFFSQQPLAIQMPDLRIVHACWDAAAIEQIATIPLGEVLGFIHDCETMVNEAARKDNLHARYQAEMNRWAKQLEDPDNPPPYLDAVAEYEALRNQLNPVKRLTSGPEALSEQAFFSGHRWRYCDRIPWWDNTDDRTPTVIGHYWRLPDTPKKPDKWRYQHLFKNIPALSWHGRHQQVFCLDYSVGARWSERRQKSNLSAEGTVRNQDSAFRLAAMLWPERELVFDTGERLQSQ